MKLCAPECAAQTDPAFAFAYGDAASVANAGQKWLAVEQAAQCDSETVLSDEEETAPAAEQGVLAPAEHAARGDNEHPFDQEQLPAVAAAAAAAAAAASADQTGSVAAASADQSGPVAAAVAAMIAVVRYTTHAAAAAAAAAAADDAAGQADEWHNFAPMTAQSDFHQTLASLSS